MVTDLCSIGTLFAFVLVCAGVLVLQNKTDIPRGKFKTPYINAKYIMPGLIVLTIILSFTYNREASIDFITNKKAIINSTSFVTSLKENQIGEIKKQIAGNDSDEFAKSEYDLETYLSNLDETKYTSAIESFPVPENQKYESGFRLFKHKIPIWIFIFISFGLAVWTYRQNLSLIPLLGLVSCLYMMAELGLSNWIGFGIWLLAGLIIYFSYSRKNSKLNRTK